DGERLGEEAARVDDVGGDGTGAQRPLLDGAEVPGLAEVDAQRDDVVVQVLSHPGDGDAGVEPAAVGEHAARPGGAGSGLPGHRVPSRIDRTLRPSLVAACPPRQTAMTVSSPATVPATSARCAWSMAAATSGAVLGRERTTAVCSTTSMPRTCSRTMRSRR